MHLPQSPLLLTVNLILTARSFPNSNSPFFRIPKTILSSKIIYRFTLLNPNLRHWNRAPRKKLVQQQWSSNQCRHRRHRFQLLAACTSALLGDFCGKLEGGIVLVSTTIHPVRGIIHCPRLLVGERQRCIGSRHSDRVFTDWSGVLATILRQIQVVLPFFFRGGFLARRARSVLIDRACRDVSPHIETRTGLIGERNASKNTWVCRIRSCRLKFIFPLPTAAARKRLNISSTSGRNAVAFDKSFCSGVWRSCCSARILISDLNFWVIGPQCFWWLWLMFGNINEIPSFLGRL